MVRKLASFSMLVLINFPLNNIGLFLIGLVDCGILKCSIILPQFEPMRCENEEYENEINILKSLRYFPIKCMGSTKLFADLRYALDFMVWLS